MMRQLLLLLAVSTPILLSGQDYLERINDAVEFGDTSQLHQLITLEYMRLLGTAEKIQDDTLYFKVHTAPEVSKVPAGEIRYLGNFNPRDRRAGLALSPGMTDMTYERTALPFKARARLKTIMAVYIVGEYNINDHVQVGLGLAGPLGILLTGRMRTSLRKNIHIALSNQTLYVPLINTFDGRAPLVGDVTALLTFGSDRSFLNLGYGYFYNTDTQGERIWLNRLGAGGQLGPYWHAYVESLISLNRTFRELELYPSVNAAYAKRRHRWRFGVMTAFFDADNFIPGPIPYVGYELYW